MLQCIEIWQNHMNRSGETITVATNYVITTGLDTRAGIVFLTVKEGCYRFKKLREMQRTSGRPLKKSLDKGSGSGQGN